MSKATMKPELPPSLAWTTVFVPALCYVLSTRMRQYSALGQVVVDFNVISKDDSLFNQPLHRIFSSSSSGDNYNNNNNIVSSMWRHDSEMGRGHLLWSDASGNGRLWRWEVGGGPIAIGRTLQLEQSGCRASDDCCTNGDESSNKKNCVRGSTAIAVDFSGHDHPAEGRLAIAEVGERRIVRLEENGARTPLVLNVPNICNEGGQVMARLGDVVDMVFTPTGELIFVERRQECDKTAVWMIPRAMHTIPLPSLKVSRNAHKWKEMEQVPSVEMLVEGNRLAGVAISPTLETVVISVLQESSVLIKQVPYVEQLEDMEEEDEILHDFASWKSFNVTHHRPSARMSGPLTVTADGKVLLGVNNGWEVIDPVAGLVVASVETNFSPTSLTLGGDGFLYVTTKEEVFRTATKEKPLFLPTDKTKKIATS